MDEIDIRDRLLAYRASRGWSQVRTAEEAGLANATISNIEAGLNTRPRRITLMKLSQAFGVSLDEFLSDNPPKAPGPSLPGTLLRSRAGHDYLTRSLAETVMFGQAASTDEIRKRIRDLAEESRVLREARLKPPEYLPPEALRTPGALKEARKEIRAVSKGFVLRVMALAEIGGDKDLIAEAERIIKEHQGANVPA